MKVNSMTTTTKTKTIRKRKTQYVIKKKIEGKKPEGPNHKLLNMI